MDGRSRTSCSEELRDYLDMNIPGWRDDHSHSRGRGKSNPNHNPMMMMRESAYMNNFSNNPIIKSEMQQHYKQRQQPSTEALMPLAEAIVQRYVERGYVLPSLKVDCLSDPSRTQERKDAGQLHSWKIHTTEKLTPEVLTYLDAKMPGWRKQRNRGYKRVMSIEASSIDKRNNPYYESLLKAQEIIQRCYSRVERGLHCLPRHLTGREDTPEHFLERNDARKLSSWKRDLQSMDEGVLSYNMQELKSFLDRKLPEWITIDCVSPETYSSPALNLPGYAGIIEYPPPCSTASVNDQQSSNSVWISSDQDMPDDSCRVSCCTYSHSQDIVNKSPPENDEQDDYQNSHREVEQDSITALLQLKYGETLNSNGVSPTSNAITKHVDYEQDSLDKNKTTDSV